MVIRGSKNKFEILSAVDPGNLLEISTADSSKKQRGLSDHPFTGPLFTWTNKQQDTFLSHKLDRILVNSNWIETFPSYDVEFQAPGNSDHCPGLVWLHKKIHAAMPKPFKFFNFWTEYPNFMTIIMESWQAPVNVNPMSCYSDISGRVRDKREELKSLYLVNLDPSTSSMNIHVEVETERELRTLEEMGVADPEAKGSNVSTIKELLGYSFPRNATDTLCKDISDAEIKEELVRGYSRKNISPRCALKIDLQKAFDSLNWEFVGVILHALGFPDKFISWIWACFTNPRYSIVLNGSLVGYFIGARGVRQGDPISLYIFILAMNVLSNLLNVAALNGVFGYHPKCKRIGLTYLCFVDDLLIFCKGSIDSVIGVQVILDHFYSMSGLKLNASKCQIYVTGIPAEQISFIREFTGFNLGTLPVRYLGVPLVTRKLVVNDCQALIDKLREKLSLWANKHLSFARRLQLIRSVLLSISNYWCRQLILSYPIIRKVEQLCSRFFWNGADVLARGARVNWKIICLMKSEGGLGL
ncbi:uncharacterized protein LOC120122379 [Hibiscus syriacus]|uniref:uncharacterized protein LOC120122379 n=1 Tax=Hibiscus syriacus TaxID=106335 RepID=UPI001922D083|nr:uncharacterized protein LOC120122379 [Hibiscus syriacus]